MFVVLLFLDLDGWRGQFVMGRFLKSWLMGFPLP